MTLEGYELVDLKLWQKKNSCADIHGKFIILFVLIIAKVGGVSFFKETFN